jgi:hypothetical protein
VVEVRQPSWPGLRIGGDTRRLPIEVMCWNTPLTTAGAVPARPGAAAARSAPGRRCRRR